MAISFDSIAGGALNEKFRMALAQVGRNIMDPNSDPEAKRGIRIELTFKPMKSGAIDVDFKVDAKLAGSAKDSTTFMISQDAKTGRIAMNEYGAKQIAPAAYEEPQDVRSVDPDTGEIYEQQNGPIDLRKASSL